VPLPRHILRQQHSTWCEQHFLSADDVHLTSSTKTLRHWDSLRHVELVVAIEEAFNVSFSAAEVFGLTSVQGFCEMLARKNVDLHAL